MGMIETFFTLFLTDKFVAVNLVMQTWEFFDCIYRFVNCENEQFGFDSCHLVYPELGFKVIPCSACGAG